MSVKLEKDEFVFQSDGGLVQERFRLADAADGFISSPAGLSLFLARGRLLISLANGWIYQFANPTTTRPVARLEAIRDLNGNVCHCINTNSGLQEIIDANGRSSRIVRDMDARIIAIELEGGAPGIPKRLVSYEYDRQGDLVSVVDRCGAESEYRYDDHLMVGFRNRTAGWYYANYDSSRRCIRTWRSDGRQTKTYYHDPHRRQILIQDAKGFSTLCRLNEEGKLVQQIDPLNDKTNMVYGPQGGLVGTMNGSGLSSTVTASKTAGKFETRLCGADGATYTVTTDPVGRQEVTADGVGAKWTRNYDEAANLIEVVTPLGARYLYQYDARGQLASSTMPNGNVVRYSFSSDYRLLEVTDTLGLVGILEWDEEGRLIRRQMPECNSERYLYDALGRLTEIVRPNGASLKFQLDPEGNCVSIITETGDPRDAEWSPFGELISGLDPLGARVIYEYDELGRLASLTNGLSEATRMEYDAAYRLVSQVFFDGSSERYSYDRRGFLDSITYGDGSSERLKFDDAGRIAEITAGEQRLRIQQGPHGLPVATEHNGVKVQYEYDLEAHPVLEIQDGVAMARQFDPAGNCLALSVETLGVRNFEYDLRDRLVAITDFNQQQLRISYDLRDRIKSITLGADLALSYDYFPENRIRSINLSNSRERREIVYAYDRSGRIISRQGPSPDKVKFEYRADGYLGRSSNNGRSQTYRYTEAGDLLEDASGMPAVYSTGRRAVSAGTTAYEFDDRGRVVQIASPGQKLDLTYDHLNWLVKADSSLNGPSEYSYDALARRTRKITASGETKFLWDGEWLLAELGSGPDQKRTYLGSAWRVFCAASLAGTEEAALILSDLNGLPLAAATSSTLAASTSSTEWGQSIFPALQNSLRLAGQYVDSETGLYYNRNRYYDPQLRRYLTPDPIGLDGSINLYAYQTDPVNSIDPFGLASVSAHNCPPGTPTPKSQPPTTISSDPGCSRGSSVHNDCISKTRARARTAGYTTRADQSMTTGTGANRPDLSMSMNGQPNVHVEWDNPPASRAAGHLADICAADPGAVVFLVKLSARYGAPGGPSPGATTPGTRTPSSKMGKGSGLSDSDCGIDDINNTLSSQGMTTI